MIKDGKYVLVLNLGLRSIRAIVFDDKGKKLNHHWLPVRTFIEDDKVEQDPEEWWTLALRVIDKTLSDPEMSKRIGYITVTSSSCNLVLVDKEQKALGRCIMVSDKRSKKEADAIANDETLQRILQNHNILPVPSFLIPKILWLKKNEPERFTTAEKYISSDSYLLMRLSGEVASDPLNAEKAFYDVENEEYPQEILELLELENDHFAPVKPVGHILGNLLPELVTQFNLPAETKIVQTTYDALAAFWGSGAIEEGEACMVSGTCTSIRVNSGQGLPKKLNGILAQYFAHKAVFVIGGSNNLEGGLLEWAKNAFYYDSFSKDDNYLFQLMEEEAKTSKLGAKGLIFLPYLIGERAPFFDTEVRGSFFGLERTHTRKDIVRAIFESIGFLSLDMIQSLEKNGVCIDALRLSGGLGRTHLIAQLKADITGKPVHILNETETTALGCFILIAQSLDPDLDNKELRSLIDIKTVCEPNKENHEKYLLLFQLFKNFYETNRKNFVDRNEIVKKIYVKKEEEISNL